MAWCVPEWESVHQSGICFDFLGLNATMSDSDDQISSLASISSDEQLSSDLSEEKEEIELLGQVQPYMDKPPAHTSDEEEDAGEDQDGLSPAVLRSRLEREVPLN